MAKKYKKEPKQEASAVAKPKGGKAEASAVAKPRKGGGIPVSIDARDDEPSEERVGRAAKHRRAGTKDEAAESSDKSEYEPTDDDDDDEETEEDEAQREQSGSSSDESSSTPLATARQAAAELSRGSKTATTAAASSRSSAVAEPEVVPSRQAPLVNDVAAEWFGKRDAHQHLGSVGGAMDTRAFRDRQKRRGDANQRNRPFHMPQNVMMVDRDMPAEDIDAAIFGKDAKSPHVCVIFVDMATDEPSTAYDHLCKLADNGYDGASAVATTKQQFKTPKKTVYRLGREEATYGFVVLHNGRISQGMYDDHIGLHSPMTNLIRFGTLHLALSPCEHDSEVKTICMGIVLVRRSATTSTTFGKADAQMLAQWTHKETHDMIVACTGRDTVAKDTWNYFGLLSGAKNNRPLFQPVLKPKSSDGTVSCGDPNSDFHACPQMVFVYGDITRVTVPMAAQIKPFGKDSGVREGRLMECLIEEPEIPIWFAPPATNLSHRQALGEVTIKPIQWEKSPAGVLPLYIFYDHPSRTTGKNAITINDAAITDKGNDVGIDKDKGKRKDSDKRIDKDEGKRKDSGKRIDKDEGKRIRLRESQQQQVSVTPTSRPRPPPVPPPSDEPKPNRRARSASPRRPSPGRHPSRSSRGPRSSSPGFHHPHREINRGDKSRLQPEATWSAVATTRNVPRPRMKLHRDQRSKAATARPARRPDAAVARSGSRRSRSPARRPNEAVARSAARRSPSRVRRSQADRSPRRSRAARSPTPIQRLTSMRRPLSAPRRNPSPERVPERHTMGRRRGTIAAEYPSSVSRQMPEDPEARAAYVKAYTPTFVRNYKAWCNEAPEERGGPFEDDTDLSAEDIDEFDTERDRAPARVTMTSRSSTCVRGESSRRSRSRSRARATERRPPAQHATHRLGSSNQSSRTANDPSGGRYPLRPCGKYTVRVKANQIRFD